VAFLAPPGFHYVAIQWGIWRAGGIAIPLAVSHPPAELEHVIRDADAETVVVYEDFAAVMQGVHLPPATRTVTTDEAVGTAPRSLLPRVAAGRRAMIVYTSGTTGRPKGVVTTHANIAAQVASLVTAWEWRADDWILLVLPLHHVHGIINVLTCALWAGARCEMLPKFDAERVWARIGDGDLTLFMAVPTIYGKLITAWEAAAPERRRAWSAGCAPPRMRLMVSGSAALPVQRLERWREITGHVLLERYGMTEIGMALANPLHGERRPGFVGTPLPGVEVVLRTHPAIAECAVVGVDDPEWGERICAAVERRGEAELTLAELQAWAKERLAPYKIPRALRSVPTLPRNALGKVTKPEVAKLFTG